MTPSLFDLPLRVGDAAALAGVILEQLRKPGAPLNDDVRGRIAGRANGLKFQAMRPLMASLERDPVHPSAYYVCVDGVDDQPLLLRMAPASTPSSGLFPKAILIGRTYIGPSEAVLNAVPFGPGDNDRIRAFSEKVNPAFLPKPATTRPVIRVRAGGPGAAFPVAFEGFRKILRTTGQNMAAFSLTDGQDAEAFYFTAVWSAIRTGWREGYALEAPGTPVIDGVRGRPFETQLTFISRDVTLMPDMTRGQVLELF